MKDSENFRKFRECKASSKTKVGPGGRALCEINDPRKFSLSNTLTTQTSPHHLNLNSVPVEALEIRKVDPL